MITLWYVPYSSDSRPAKRNDLALSDPPHSLSSMARRQTRRSVSINRYNYEAAKQEAARRGMTLAGLVESALAAIGVPTVAHPQQPVALAQANAARRAEGMAARRGRRARRARRPSRECQVLGDRVADAFGFA
jgi:hypothetical protein